MAHAKNLSVIVDLVGSEQMRAEAYQKALRFVIGKCMCEVIIDESNNLCEGIDRGTGGEGLLGTGAEGRMY